MLGLLVVAVILLVYSAVSKPLDARGVTSAMVFTAAGFVVGSAVLSLVDLQMGNATAQRITELALALLLFSDAARLDLRSLRRQLSWPGRLLLIGLPLTLLAGTGAGLLVFPGMALTTAFLLSTMLAATDAALGQRVVSDPAVPDRVRQALDVESGLNDGLAVPFFLVAVAMARRGAQLPTLAFIGWFGPRGLASIVFGLLLVESGAPHADMLLAVVTVTVTLSVFAHGLTSAPLVRAYRRWYAAHAAVHPDAAEAAPTKMSRLRRQFTPKEARSFQRQAGVLAADSREPSSSEDSPRSTGRLE